MIDYRLRMIFTKDELNRITVSVSAHHTLFIMVDVHGLTCCEARRFINNIINVIQCPFQLEVIHGYTHGTAIKEMLATNFRNVRITERHPDSYNYGVTYMTLAA